MTLEEELKTSKFKSHKHKAILNILFTAGFIETKINTFLKKYGLTHQQYNLLRILKGSFPKPLSGLDIQSRMIDRMSNVSRLLDKLKDKNLIHRNICPSDRRMVEVSLTEAGIALLESIEIDNVPEVDLSEEKAEVIANLLDEIRK